MRNTRARTLVLLIGLSVGVAACGGAGGSVSSSKAAALPARSVSGAPAPSLGGAPDRVPANTAASAAAGLAAPQSQAQTLGAPVAPATADIVENGTLDVQLRTPAALRSSYSAITALAGGAGGFVAASTLTNGAVPSASITLRVPNVTVRAAIARIGAMGRVLSQTLSGRDVTGQVVNLAVEITNLTSEERAVRQLLSNAGSVADILAVQQQLFQLQDEIQQLTAQSNSLDNRVQYATVTVALSTPTPVPPPVRHHPPITTVSRFWHLARDHTVALVRGVFLAIGWSAPGLVLLTVALGGAWLVLRRRRSSPPRVATADDGP